MTDKQDRRAFFRELGRYSALGLELAISVIIGLAVGYYLDKWLRTRPWMTVVWVGGGGAGGSGWGWGSRRAYEACIAPPSNPGKTWKKTRRTKGSPVEGDMPGGRGGTTVADTGAPRGSDGAGVLTSRSLEGEILVSAGGVLAGIAIVGRDGGGP